MRWRRARLFLAPSQQSEHADHAVPANERHRADVDGDSVSPGRHQNAGRLGRRGGSKHLAREELACPRPVLRPDHLGEVPASHLAEQLFRGGVDPADDAVCVENVARHGNAGQGLLDVTAECQPAFLLRHSGSVIERRPACHLRHHKGTRAPAALRPMRKTRTPTPKREHPGLV
jgi:hypothetical protein